jgi:mono/diheme cytochrome c family protein
MRLARRNAAAAATLCWAAAIAGASQQSPTAAPVKPGAVHFANADDPAAVALGGRLYIRDCAGCHGRYRQGQPLWQLADQYAGWRAPALDETGTAWRRSDEALFSAIKYGRPAAPLPGTEIAMPAFADVLDDDQVLAVVAFIKARWPLGLRIAQAMLNPGLAGMPADAADGSWRLPPNCTVIAPGGSDLAPPSR